MATAIFVIVIFILSIWTYKSGTSYNMGEKTMMIPIAFLWIAVFYFYFNPEISKYHILWVAPSIVICEHLLFNIVVKAYYFIKNKMNE